VAYLLGHAVSSVRSAGRNRVVFVVTALIKKTM